MSTWGSSSESHVSMFSITAEIKRFTACCKNQLQPLWIVSSFLTNLQGFAFLEITYLNHTHHQCPAHIAYKQQQKQKKSLWLSLWRVCMKKHRFKSTYFWLAARHKNKVWTAGGWSFKVTACTKTHLIWSTACKFDQILTNSGGAAVISVDGGWTPRCVELIDPLTSWAKNSDTMAEWGAECAAVRPLWFDSDGSCDLSMSLLNASHSDWRPKLHSVEDPEAR